MTKVEPGWFDVTTVYLTLPRLDPAFAGFRLAQISDIHYSSAMPAEKVDEAVRITLDCQPDLVAITGDFLHIRRNYSSAIPAFSEVLRKLTGAVQVVGTLGNHDYRVGASRTRKMLEDVGIRELRNDVLALERGEARLYIAGVDDPWLGEPRLDSVVGQLPDDGAAILLAHEPDFADRSAETGRFDLQISGHTHGGQVVLPLLGPPMLPHMGEKYPSGLYRVGTMYQYTNRGLGMIPPFVRFNCRPEITLFVLQPAEVI